MGAAIAYEDWARTGNPVTGVWTLPRIGTEAAVVSPQLSDLFGISYTTGQAGSSLGRIYGRNWGDLRPVRIVSLLDIRISGTAIFDLFLLGGTGGGLVVSASVGYDGFPSSQFVRHLHFILPETRQSSGVQVYMRRNTEVADGAGQITAGRLWAGPLWEAPNGIFRSWETSIRDPGEVSRSRGGQGYARDEQRIRSLRMELAHVPTELAFGVEDNTVLDLQQLGMRIGTTSPVMVFPRTEDQHSIHRLGVYGTMTEGMRIRHGAGDQFNAGFEVVEQL